MKTDYENIELKMRVNVEHRLAEGWLVAPGSNSWTYDGSCCAVGASMVEENGADAVMFGDELGRKWGLPNGFMDSVSRGFERDPIESFTDRKAYRIGSRIRRDYCVSRAR